MQTFKGQQNVINCGNKALKNLNNALTYANTMFSLKIVSPDLEAAVCHGEEHSSRARKGQGLVIIQVCVCVPGEGEVAW